MTGSRRDAETHLLPSFRRALTALGAESLENSRERLLPMTSAGATAMLRIITEQRGKTCRMEVHGTIAGEGLDVLERHWRGILDRAPAAHITVGLTNVAFIDIAGEELLRRMAEHGVQFDGAGLMNRYVMQKIAGGL